MCCLCNACVWCLRFCTCVNEHVCVSGFVLICACDCVCVRLLCLCVEILMCVCDGRAGCVCVTYELFA
jgi:hypothetical protein